MILKIVLLERRHFCQSDTYSATREHRAKAQMTKVIWKNVLLPFFIQHIVISILSFNKRNMSLLNSRKKILNTWCHNASFSKKCRNFPAFFIWIQGVSDFYFHWFFFSFSGKLLSPFRSEGKKKFPLEYKLCLTHHTFCPSMHFYLEAGKSVIVRFMLKDGIQSKGFFKQPMGGD